MVPRAIASTMRSISRAACARRFTAGAAEFFTLIESGHFVGARLVARALAAELAGVLKHDVAGLVDVVAELQPEFFPPINSRRFSRTSCLQ
jgi:hypothetical protein